METDGFHIMAVERDLKDEEIVNYEHGKKI